MTRPYRIGVVGLGKIAQVHHVPAIVDLPELELAAVCDLSGALARRVAASYGLPVEAATDDIDALLDHDLDGVLIATTHHGPVLQYCLSAGLPTLVEKPCTWTLSEADAAIAVATERKVPVVVGYTKQYDAAVERLRSRAEPALYLRVHNFAGGRHRHERVHPVTRPGDDRPVSAVAEDDQVTGLIASELGDDDPQRIAVFKTLALLAVHDLNVVRALAGEPDEASMQMHSTPAGPCFLITLDYPAMRVLIEVLADFASSRDWDEHLTAYTATGSSTVRFASPFLRYAPSVLETDWADGTDIRHDRLVVSHESAFVRQARHFAAVLGGEPPRTGLGQARADLALVYDLARKAALP